MMSVAAISRKAVAPLVLLLLALTPTAALAQDGSETRPQSAVPQVGSGGISFQTAVPAAGWTLTVTGPEGLHFERTFSDGERPAFSMSDLGDSRLPDGAYTWELRPIMESSENARPRLGGHSRDSDSDERRGLTGRAPADVAAVGHFRVVGGSILRPSNRPEPASAGSAAPAGDSVGTRDQVISDDLIVDGSACIGFDCANGEAFGFDTIKLKENNLRIKFDDTSSSPGFPDNDWQITANGSANGGVEKFAIDDISGGRTPFTIEAGAPSHSLYVDDGGRIGLGTATPVVEIHSVDGDTPTLRLAQDGSSGFEPQTWDVAGNETNFFIRDATSGSTLPFRIRGGAPTSSLDISSDGELGVGTSNPSSTIHVRRTDGTASFTVEEASGSNAARTLLSLENNGVAKFRLQDTAAGDNFVFAVGASSFYVTASGSGGPEFQVMNDGRVFMGSGGSRVFKLFTTGDVTIDGTLTEGSSRAIKTNFAPVDERSVLSQVLNLEIPLWSYTADPWKTRHIGPMAEDFHATFGVGKDAETLAPKDIAGVALVAVKGLYDVVEERTAAVDAQGATLEQLLELVDAQTRLLEDQSQQLRAHETALETLRQERASLLDRLGALEGLIERMQGDLQKSGSGTIER